MKASRLSPSRRWGASCAPAIILLLQGCAETPGRRGDEASLSVSAVNYSRLSDSEVYAAVNGPPNASPVIPAAAQPAGPQFYLIVPGEIYPSDVSLDSLYHDLAVSLQQRGYYSALAQVKAGRKLQLDYLLRVHFGVRPWSNPVVRTDRVTWSNDGLLAKRYKTRIVSDLNFDPRQGLSREEEANLNQFLQMTVPGKGGRGAGGTGADNAAELGTVTRNARDTDLGDGSLVAQDFCFVVIEAFRFADVKALNGKAPCVWMIFMAVPTENRRKLSEVLAAMLKSAVPYYGETTQGLQVFEVPVGKVLLGTPTEVPEKATH
jgi:hypothetical protein